MIHNSKNKGQMLIELLLTIGLLAIIFPAILTGIIASREGKPQHIQRDQAVTLLKETEQAVRSVRDMGWTNIATFSATPLHPVISSSHWALVTGSETIDTLTRQIIISDVYRDTDGKITESGGTIDPSIKKITTTISWNSPFSSSINSSLYLSRTTNATQSQTTQTDFNAGTKDSVIVEATSGTSIPDNGQIKLATGSGNWCNPLNDTNTTLTLPKSANSIVAFPGAAPGSPDKVYLGTGNGLAGASLTNINISDTNPPVPAIAGTYSSTDTTNAIYENNGYAFLATNATTNQVKIIQLSNNTLFATINLGSNSPANGIYVDNSVLYVTSSDKIYIYNVSNINNIQQLPTTRLQAGGKGEQIVVSGTKLYVSVSNSNLILQVFSINTGGGLADWSISKFSHGSIPGPATAKGLTVNNALNRAYVAFSNASVPNGFYIFDTSQKGNSPNFDPPYNANGMSPKNITLATSDIAILVGTGGTEQYQVIKGLSTDNPVHCGGMTVTGGATGVATVNQQDSDVYSYLISGAEQDQFIIIEGGAGGSSGTTGSFESSTMNVNSSSAFNNFTANITKPAGTNIQMQVAVAQAPPPGTSCDGATYTFVGPNGNTSQYFTPNGSTITGQIPFGSFSPSYQNPAQCFRYRAYFSTDDSSITPYLNDITVNYSQ
jgi:hypothetical protein